jgi:phosphoribosylformylglycinamidine (FGAM) synthase-like enzyme
MLFGKKTFGAEVDLTLRSGASRLDALLFGESQNRVVLAVPGNVVESVVESANDAGVPVDIIGKVTTAPIFDLRISGKEVFQTEVEMLRALWDNAIPEYMSRI